MDFRIKPAGFCPICGSPGCSIDGQLRKGRKTQFTFHGWPHHERTNPDFQFTEFYVGTRYGNRIICRCCNADSATNTLTLNTRNDKLRAFAHAVNDMRESIEKILSLAAAIDFRKFFER